ncbi:ShlB/FhaC/HecB family hemolysin secretion/activation protein [Hyphomicrobium methylovorum]|nr:ShlB/FhaC/HecB family hemolysin secretion/activation protein [Hyphomicrobium methylovorum]
MSRIMSRSAYSYRARQVATAFFASAALVPQVAAQNYDAGTAAREGEQAQKYAPQPQRGGVLDLPQLVEPQLNMPQGEKLHIRTIAVSGGDDLVPSQSVRALLKPYEGRRLSLAQIYEVADKITALYREAGYLVAKVYVPEQDARGGTLNLKLVPGRYGRVTVNNASLIRDHVIDGILVQQGVTEGPLIEKNGLERAMLLISDLSGAGMPRSVMGAGRAQGTSDFQFEVPEGRRFDGFVLEDNFGTPYTGRWRTMAGINANSLLGLGDRLSVFGMISENTDLMNGRVAYSVPIGYDGLRAEAAVYRTDYALGDQFASLDAAGTVDGISGALFYPLLRSREDTIVVSAVYNYKRLNDLVLDMSTNYRKINEGTVSINRERVGELFGLPLVTSSNLGLTIGNVEYPDAAQLAFNKAGADTAGDFQKISGGITLTLALAQKLSLVVDARGQKSLSGNLDSSEQFGLSGIYGIRSLNEGLSGDSGWVITPELKYALPDIYAWHHAASVFIDVGGVALENGDYTTTQPDYLSTADIGIGYYGTYEHSPGRALMLKAYLAHTIHESSDTQSYSRGSTVGLLQAGITF